MNDTLDGAERILRERVRQTTVEGWTPEHDDQHTDSQLVLAALCYAAPVPIKAKLNVYEPSRCGCREASCPHESLFRVEKWVDPWPWWPECDKREKHNEIRRLEIAGALIAAEIDRLLRVNNGQKVESA